ncbi:MAG: hypothetical protein MJY80_02965 [Bacteroidales bacterium]|nr:hypothetical protein [Bacteroidales bacterium]
MKKIEDIENISLETLEAISVDAGREVPEGLKNRIRDAILANDVISTAQKLNPVIRIALPAVSFALAASLAVLLLMPHVPKDTFEDPLEAYAEVEKTLAYISSKVGTGRDIAGEAAPLIEKTVNYSDKIIIK